MAGQVSNNSNVRGQLEQQGQKKQLLPIDSDGTCMACDVAPHVQQTVTCTTCRTPWHVDCLTEVPETMQEVASYVCSRLLQRWFRRSSGACTGAFLRWRNILAKVHAIEADAMLTERQKANKRQQLLGGRSMDYNEERKERMEKDEGNEAMDILSRSISCSFCMQLPERPITTPCGHNFCLKCFQKWIGQGKRTCAKCRSNIPSHLASQPRIDSTIVATIRRARMLRTSTTSGEPMKVYHSLKAEDLPDESFNTERAKKGGIANAKYGRIFVTVPSDHFGPISAENDPVLNLGVLVGQCFQNRHKCRQWGVHQPLVCGISGQANVGAQSVVLSGGYMDDEDHRE